MYCVNCGYKLSENDHFCRKCGARVSGIKAEVTPLFGEEPSVSQNDSTNIQSKQEALDIQENDVQIPAPDIQPSDNMIGVNNLNTAQLSQSVPQIESVEENTTEAETSTVVAPEAVSAAGENVEYSVENVSKKRGGKGKIFAVIAVIFLLAMAAAAAFWLFGGDDIEVSDEVLAAIIEEGRFDSVEPPVEIVAAKIMGTEEATLFGIDVKDEHVTIKIENDYASAKKCFIVSSYKEDGKWLIEYVKENNDPCDHGSDIIVAKKDLTAEDVEKDVRAYFSDETAECSDIVIPQYNENDEMPVVVTLTVYGDIFGEQMRVDVTAQYYISFIDGWYIGYATYEESQYIEETLPDTQTDAPETDSPETDAPETDAPETDAPETDAPETDAPETDAADNNGGYMGPDQPVSDETVLSELMQNNYENWTKCEIVDSGYNFDGTYTFRCHATGSDEYLPIVPVYLVDQKYVRHDGNYTGNPWYCRSRSYSFRNFESSYYLLGTWNYSDNDNTYSLEIYDIKEDDRHYGDVSVTVYFRFAYNGEIVERQYSGYYTNGANCLKLQISSVYLNDDEAVRLSFNAYKQGEGITGWYIDDEILLEKAADSDSADDEKTTTLMDPNDLIGTWAFIESVGEYGEGSVFVRVFSFDENGNFTHGEPVFDRGFSGTEELQSAAFGPHFRREGKYMIDDNIWEAIPDTLMMFYTYNGMYGDTYTKCYEIKRFVPGVEIILEESMYMENPEHIHLYYIGIIGDNLVDYIDELAEKQGVDIYA